MLGKASLCSRELVKMFFGPPFALGSLSKRFFYLPLLYGVCQNVFFTSFCSRGLVKTFFFTSLYSRELVKMFFLPPFALGDLSKEFGNCFRFIFSLWCHRFHLPFAVFSGAPTVLQQLFLCFRPPRRCFNNYFCAFGRPDGAPIIIFVFSGAPTVLQ